MNIFKKAVWSPYAVGTGIGLISFLAFLFFRKTLGISTAFIKIFGFFAGIVSVDHVSKTPYLSRFVEYKPVFEWQVALLVGIILGAFISTKLSGVTFSAIPYLWGKNFGFSTYVRSFGAISGGLLIMFGARLAGGCPLGNGVSEGMHFVTTAWIFLPTMFLAGIASAFVLYRKK